MRALILIDIQNDFLPTGTLPVHDGNLILPVCNRLLDSGYGDLVVASQDWHPANHGSFASQHAEKKPGEVIDLNGRTQVLWPDHCVQFSPGARLVTELRERRIEKIFYKGADVSVDSYSCFFDNGRAHSTGLGSWLRIRGVHQVTLVGLATDYCVKFSALDALDLGFETTIVSDACRGVNLSPGDSEAALGELAECGAHIALSERASMMVKQKR